MQSTSSPCTCWNTKPYHHHHLHFLVAASPCGACTMCTTPNNIPTPCAPCSPMRRTWSPMDRLRRPADRRTTVLGMTTRAVAMHRTRSSPEGGS